MRLNGLMQSPLGVSEVLSCKTCWNVGSALHFDCCVQGRAVRLLFDLFVKWSNWVAFSNSL